MHVDVAIIGAGVSGLAAGIRLAYFEKSVCIFERHYAYGGLNSYYRLHGRDFDVGLHALTNFAPPQERLAPLNKLLRQLRIPREELDLQPQSYSLIHFPDRRLAFSNDADLLVEEVARTFPGQADRFHRLLDMIRAYDDVRLDHTYHSARRLLGEYLTDPVLIDMLLCPIMYYGSPQEHDMDQTHFITLFKSIFLEGLARPQGGVRTILKALVRRYRANGGKLRMRCGVRSLTVSEDRVTGLTLDNGEEVTAEVVLSCAGYLETMALCARKAAQAAHNEEGRLSFVEALAVLDAPPRNLGFDPTIVFFSDQERFVYARPEEGLVDQRSGVLCCPTNYEGQESAPEGLLRLTWLANYDAWSALDSASYRASKEALLPAAMERFSAYVPAVVDRVVCTDMFTPCTIRAYTGHFGGAVYGSPRKRRDGRTPLRNLFICGTDQGFLGIIGALLSGITVANLHVLSQD